MLSRPFSLAQIFAALGLALMMMTSAGAPAKTPVVSPVTDRAVVENYIELVRASYADTLREAEEMETAIGVFLDAPSEETLQAAKQAWLDAREIYGQTEAYRFYDGPIDHPETGVEGLLNAWPMDEGWVDYTVESPDAGIVNNPGDHPEITKALLVEMNEREGETNIASGFHAIEFLLWGQDLSADGPGQRLASDYVPGEAANAQRRAAYLRAAADLLTDHLSEVVQAWDADNPDNYGDKLLAEDSSEALQKIFTGIGMLAGDELAGERMAVAYETQDQEDEHSCFSDSTRADLIANALGIHNVYRGQWSDKVNGPGLDALLAASAPEARREVDDALRQALKAIRAIPQPFDQALLGDDDAPARVALLKAVEASEDLADAIARAAESLGLSINIEAES